MIQTMKKLKSGYINGTRVMLGSLGDFLNTSAITDLSFLGSQEDGYPDSESSKRTSNAIWYRNIRFFSIAGLNPDIQAYLDEHLFRSFSQKSTVNIRQSTARPRQLRRRMSCKGAIKKTRSINADSEYLLFSKVIISSDFHHPHRHRGGWMLRMTFSYSVQLLNDIAAYGSWLYPLRMDFSCKFCFTCQYTIAIS